VFVFGDGENWFKQNKCIALTVSPDMETTVWSLCHTKNWSV